MGDNIWLFDRNGVRTPMQWEDEVNAGFSTARPEQLYAPVIDNSEYGAHKVNVARHLADPHSLLNAIKHMLVVRKSRPEMGWGSFAWIETDDPAVIACRRDWQGQTLVAVSNLSVSEVDVQLEMPGPGVWRDLLAGGAWQTEGDSRLHLHLPGSGFVWLVIE